jgi:hypothetical protein
VTYLVPVPKRFPGEVGVFEPGYDWEADEDPDFEVEERDFSWMAGYAPGEVRRGNGHIF